MTYISRYISTLDVGRTLDFTRISIWVFEVGECGNRLLLHISILTVGIEIITMTYLGDSKLIVSLRPRLYLVILI